MKISREFYDQIVAHALEKPKIEICGLVACQNDEAKAVYPCVNLEEERGWAGAAFEMDPLQQVLLLETIERDGHELGAIYHSHPGMSAVPSGIDLDYAKNWPGVLWIIVGIKARFAAWRWRDNDIWEELDPKPEPDVWTWRIEHGRIHTAELVVIAQRTATTPW